MNKLFILAVLVSLLFAVTIAFAADSDSASAAKGDSGASVANAVSGSSTSVQGAKDTVPAPAVTPQPVSTPAIKPSPAPLPAIKPAPAPAPISQDTSPATLPAIRPGPSPLPAIKPAPAGIQDTSPKPLPAIKPLPTIKPVPITPASNDFYLLILPASATLGIGDNASFTATLYINGAPASDPAVAWSTNGGVGTITQGGVFTATSAGAGEVAAAYTNINETITATAEVTVTSSPPPPPSNDTYLLVIPSQASLNVGGSQQFAAVLVVNGTTPIDIPMSWSATGGIGVIGATGLFNATSAGAGTVEAAAFYAPLNATLTGAANVTVSSSPPPPGNASYTLLINPSSSQLLVGATQQFTAQLYDENGTYVMDVPSSDLNWSSSDTGVGSIDSLGMFTALSSGSALVKVTYTGTAFANVSSQNTASVSVSPFNPVNISYILITPSTASLFVGQSQQFTATAYDSSGIAIGAVPDANLSWSASPAIGSIGTDGTFTAIAVGSGIVSANYTDASNPLSASANVSVSAMPPAPTGGSGGGSSASNGNGGGSYQTSTTASFSCVGKMGSVKITVYDSGVKNATVEIIYMGGARSETVLSQQISGTTTLAFTPSEEGDYALHVSVGPDQTSANFFVPYCGPQSANATQNITVNLQPSRELVLSRLVAYPGGFSKRFSVYKITDGQGEAYESDIVLYYNYTGGSPKANFDILDAVPSSILASSGQITFQDRPGAVSQGPSFSWHVNSISNGGRLSYAYSFSRPLTDQMISLFSAPTIREAGTGTAAIASDGGLLAASIGPIFGIQFPLIGVLVGFVVVLALLYFFLFGKKKEEE